MHRVHLVRLLVVFVGLAVADEARAEEAPPSPAAPRFEVASWTDVQQIVTKERGKIVVVDIWTTTCETCVQELPRFTALREKYKPGDVTLVTLNCDYDGIADKPPAYYRPKVESVLRESKAGRVRNLMLNISFLDFLETIDLSSTPAVLVYGRDGKLVRRFDNDQAKSADDEFGLSDVTKLVDSLVVRSAATK